MKTQLSIQERLKDLRVEKGLTLEQLSQQTKIPASTLGSYESDDYKEYPTGISVTWQNSMECQPTICLV